MSGLCIEQAVRLWGDHPNYTCGQLADALHDATNATIHVSTVYKWLRSWGLNRKKSYHFDKRKASPDNTVRYVEVLGMLREYDPKDLVFLDESHFCSVDYRTNYGYYPRGIVPMAVVNKNRDLRFTIGLACCPGGFPDGGAVVYRPGGKQECNS